MLVLQKENSSLNLIIKCKALIKNKDRSIEKHPEWLDLEIAK